MLKLMMQLVFIIQYSNKIETVNLVSSEADLDEDEQTSKINMTNAC